MANHLRRQIRDAIKTALTGLTTTGANVFTDRVYPTARGKLPCLLVHQDNELSASATLPAPRLLNRVLRVMVTAVVEAASGVDDSLDQICKEVEIALAMPCAALAGMAKVITLVATDFAFDGSAQQPVGQAAMTFEVQYMVAENAPDVAY
jgi:hypothetical protein